MPHYFEGRNYSQDLEVEKLISIYKFLLRFRFTLSMAKSGIEEGIRDAAVWHLSSFLRELERSEKDLF